MAGGAAWGGRDMRPPAKKEERRRRRRGMGDGRAGREHALLERLIPAAAVAQRYQPPSPVAMPIDDVPMEDASPAAEAITHDLTPCGVAVTPGVARALVQMLAGKVLPRRRIEKVLPSLAEQVQYTTYESGYFMAVTTLLDARLRVQALFNSDEQRVEELWAAASRRAQEEQPAGWYDRDAVVELTGLTPSVKLTRKDLCTLAPGTWLNDMVINTYFQLLVLRADALPERYPRTHALSSFWFSKLTANRSVDARGGYNYAAVKRWTRKVDVFADYDLLLIPINWAGNHWVLCTVDFQVKKIVYYDSLSSSVRGDIVCEVVHRWLADEHAARKGAPLAEVFTLRPDGDVAVPQQDNGHDCGVYTCCAASCLTANRPLAFKQQHIPYLRKRMVVELCEGRAPVPL
eukprot:TRINITY_DN16874_c0_g1_i1.p1 TRINITY_DN16874_c0_g1~~TRINITY_DN16874_c0_g1_i1.p1  ORF type:complete len:403 (+),score=138.19 TRINITY_DN16874_c0_g1_i1:97-1305(+)